MARTEIQGRGLGWRPELPMHKDYQFADRSRGAMRTMAQLPRRVLNVEYDGPVRDQGSEGSCVGHGWAAVADHITRQDGDRFTTIYSPRFAYNAARLVEQERDGNDSLSQDWGAYVRDGGLAIRKLGICQESAWRYKPNGIDYKKAPTPSRLKRADSMHVEIQRCDGVDAVLSALAARLPLTGGFICFSNWWTPAVDASGVTDMPDARARDDGGHCTKWSGYDLDFRFPSGAVGAILYKNSWSDRWAHSSPMGFRGYGLFPIDFIRRGWADDIWAGLSEIQRDQL